MGLLKPRPKCGSGPDAPGHLSGGGGTHSRQTSTKQRGEDQRWSIALCPQIPLRLLLLNSPGPSPILPPPQLMLLMRTHHEFFDPCLDFWCSFGASLFESGVARKMHIIDVPMILRRNEASPRALIEPWTLMMLALRVRATEHPHTHAKGMLFTVLQYVAVFFALANASGAPRPRPGLLVRSEAFRVLQRLGKTSGWRQKKQQR